MVRLATQEQLVIRARLVMMVQLARVEPLVHKVMMVRLATQEQLVIRARLVVMVQLVRQDLKA